MLFIPTSIIPKILRAFLGINFLKEHMSPPILETLATTRFGLSGSLSRSANKADWATAAKRESLLPTMKASMKPCVLTLILGGLALRVCVSALSAPAATRVASPWHRPPYVERPPTCIRASGIDDFYSDYDPSKYGNGYDRWDDSGKSGRHPPSRQSRGSTYTRDKSRDDSNVDEAAVFRLIEQRSKAREAGDYAIADRIRGQLVADFHVGVDDPGRTWRTGVSGSGSGSKFLGERGRRQSGGRNHGTRDRGGRGARGVVGGRGRGRGRGGGGRRPDFGHNGNGHDYHPSSIDGHLCPNNSRFSESQIHELLAQRLQAKFSRDFHQADAIQEQLAAGGVFVDDKRKEWRADGQHIVNANSQYSMSPLSEECDRRHSALISGLVNERLKFKKNFQYEKADKVREGLITNFNVIIDDRAKQWSIGGDFGPEANELRKKFEDFGNQGYAQSISSTQLSGEEVERIQQQIDERFRARKNRDFELADSIRDALLEEYDVTILDKHKLWSVGGTFAEQGSPGVYERKGKGMLSEDDEGAVVELMSKRYAARLSKDFAKSDEIRDHLMKTFNVRVDDKANIWWVDTADYAMMGPRGNLSKENMEYIDAKLRDRFLLKSDKKYEEADAIMDELRDQFGIFIDDQNKEWSVQSVDSSVGNAKQNNGNHAPKDAFVRYDSVVKHGNENFEELSPSANESQVEEESTHNNEEDDTSTIILTEASLSKLTIPLLKEKLRAHGLPVSGKKADLIARLLAA